MIPTVATALTIAANLFGPAPCGTPTIQYDSPVKWGGYTIPYDDLALSPCIIHLSPVLLEPGNSVYRCHVIVHEYGHLARGPQHSDNPNDVMYGGTPTHSYWQCRKAAKRYRVTRVTKGTRK